MTSIFDPSPPTKMFGNPTVKYSNYTIAMSNDGPQHRLGVAEAAKMVSRLKLTVSANHCLNCR